jgi:hypothetical protein
VCQHGAKPACWRESWSGLVDIRDKPAYAGQESRPVTGAIAVGPQSPETQNSKGPWLTPSLRQTRRCQTTA